jgi:hypothetical protein
MTTRNNQKLGGRDNPPVPYRTPIRFVLPPIHALGLKGDLWNGLSRLTKERNLYYGKYLAERNRVVSLRKNDLEEAKERDKQELADNIQAGKDDVLQHEKAVENAIRLAEKRQEALVEIMYQIDRDINSHLSKPENREAMKAGVEETLKKNRKKMSHHLSWLEKLIEDQATCLGALEWIKDGGTNPYTTKVPLNGTAMTHLQNLAREL